MIAFDRYSETTTGCVECYYATNIGRLILAAT